MGSAHAGKKYHCKRCNHYHGWNSKGHLKEGCEFPEKLKKKLYVMNEEVLLNIIINWSPLSNIKSVRESRVTRRLAHKTIDKMLKMKMVARVREWRK